MQRERELFEYNRYAEERKRLQDTLAERRSNIDSIRKTPKRMGISEARLHKRESGEIKQKLARYAKAIESRLDRMEKKEKPKDEISIRLDVLPVRQPVCNTLAWCKGLTLKFGKRTLFEDVSFEIPKGSKTAILGANGSGKTTLMRMIAEEKDGIIIGKSVKTGYFFQDVEALDPEKTILETVMKNSIHPEWAVRTVLARLLFRRDEVFKKVRVLSGGERVKIMIASLLLSDSNFLLLDEPTNYLDIFSMEALQSLIKEYQGTILFVSHDRRFINESANRLILMEGNKLRTFEGGYSSYLDEQTRQKNTEPKQTHDKLILEMRLTEVLSKLTLPGKPADKEELEKQYNEILNELKKYR
jgi:macrolide transport system ATP-binding/permease protein